MVAGDILKLIIANVPDMSDTSNPLFVTGDFTFIIKGEQTDNPSSAPVLMPDASLTDFAAFAVDDAAAHYEAAYPA